MKAGLINRLFTSTNVSEQKALSFQPGQIVTGKIAKLFPENIALLQLGGRKVAAQLEAPLETGKFYWFQVLSGEGKPHLKVLANADSTKQEIPHTALLKQLSLPVTEENHSLLRFLIKEQLPVKKEIFQLAGELPKDFEQAAVEKEAVRLLLTKQLPFTKSSFQAVRTALSHESFSQLLETLRHQLLQSSPTEAGRKLLAFLENWSKEGTIHTEQAEQQIKLDHSARSASVHDNKAFSEPSLFRQFLKDTVQKLGMSYEQNIVHSLKAPQEGEGINRDSLKPLIIDYLQEYPSGAIRETAETILNKITGLQLLATDSGPLQQFMLQLPLYLGHKTVDVTMQWSGKKQENGTIDPAFCRILFYIELENLQETVVDMHVQNRVIHLLVINEHEQLKQLAAPFIAVLKENLQKAEYTLSAVQFLRPEEERARQGKGSVPLFSEARYTGVDIRI